MIVTKEIITLKREVWLNTPPQPSWPAMITGVEENIFWTNLPRDGRQVLVLLENQEVSVGVSLRKGFYIADTRVLHISKESNKFYGLALPDEFKIAQERQFTRVEYPTNVLFRSGDMVAQSALVNFPQEGCWSTMFQNWKNWLTLSKSLLYIWILIAFLLRWKCAWPGKNFTMAFPLPVSNI